MKTGIRTFYLCENCDSVHIEKIGERPKCKICNGELTVLDGVQSVLNAILKDKTIEMRYSYDQARDITERPFLGWRADGHYMLF